MAEVVPGAPAPDFPLPAAEAAPAPDTTADQPAQPEGEQPDKPERRFTQKELDEIVQKRLAKESRRSERLGEERARREAAERELERMRSERNPQSQQPQGRPTPNQFQDYESFVEALSDWKVEQRIGKLREESQAQQQQRAAMEHAQSVRAKLNTGQDKYPDFEDVALADDLPISPPMAAAIAESDVSADVAYYLGTHRDEAQRISMLAPTQQVREIAKIESKLVAVPEPTKTPPPIVPNGTKTTVAKDPSKMSDKEFADWRRRQKAQKR